jgi:hypothetical protein
MCVTSPETSCSNERIITGNSDKGVFNVKNIETPYTAPDAAADLIFLHNSGNVYHQTLHTTVSTNTVATLQMSTKPPHDQSTTNQIILPEAIMYQVKFLTLSM